VVKYVAWAKRTPGQTVSEGQDAVVRESAREQGFGELPPATEGWARDQGWGTAYSSEQFPGSSPVWVWEK